MPPWLLHLCRPHLHRSVLSAPPAPPYQPPPPSGLMPIQLLLPASALPHMQVGMHNTLTRTHTQSGTSHLRAGGIWGGGELPCGKPTWEAGHRLHRQPKPPTPAAGDARWVRLLLRPAACASPPPPSMSRCCRHCSTPVPSACVMSLVAAHATPGRGACGCSTSRGAGTAVWEGQLCCADLCAAAPSLCRHCAGPGHHVEQDAQGALLCCRNRLWYRYQGWGQPLRTGFLTW